MAAVAPLTSDNKKLSFAKVAASATMDGAVGRAQPRPPVVASTPNPQRRDAALHAIAKGHVCPRPDGVEIPAAVYTQRSDTSNPALRGGADHIVEAEAAEALAKVKLSDTPPSLVVNGSASVSTGPSSKNGISQTPSDAASQKADSNSELGTKPPSSDGKSITSGTTFNALDEKESLRPDDSASVMAAAEDDDTVSIRGSLPAISRMGSDVAARVHRIQLGEIPLRPITHILPGQGISTPQSSASDQPQVAGVPLADPAAMPNAMNGLYSKTPDASLIEAMQSPKDRLFLLGLEQQVIDFVQDSKESFMDLPHMNSFFRMLVHKLADYYHMTHSFEAVAGGVRIFRTPFCRVPPSLASIAASASASSTPPPAVLPRKIMRRGEDGELALMSAGPSKPTSEAGSDGKDKLQASNASKQTREEREKAYAEHRERIFGNGAPTETSGTEKEDGTGMSRVSSVSGNKSNLGRGKKTRRRDENEGFESRSLYAPYGGGYAHAQTWMTQQYVPVDNPQFSSQVPQQLQQQQTQYMNPMQPVYQQPPQQYPQMVTSNGFAPAAVNTMSQYPQPPAQPRYSPPTGQMTGSFVPQPPTVTPQQPWQQPQYPTAPAQGTVVGSGFAPRNPGPAGQAGQLDGMGVPYPFGQLPVNVNPSDPRSQHPIPGSYAGHGGRHAFNPMTQSFIPGTGMGTMMPGPTPGQGYMAPNTMPAPVANPATMIYHGYSQMPPHPMQPQPQPLPVHTMPQPQTMGQGSYGAVLGVNGGYSMMRQSSNQPMPSFMPSPHPAPQQPKFHGSPHVRPRQPLGQHSPANIPSRPVMPQAPAPTGPSGQTFSHLPNLGNPATLPQKPTV